MLTRSSVVSLAATALERRHQRRVLRARLGVDRRHDVVGVLQVLVVLEHDQLVPGDRARTPCRRPRRRCSAAALLLHAARAGGARRAAGGGDHHGQARGARIRIRVRMSARLLCPVRPGRAATRVWREDSRGASWNPCARARHNRGPHTLPFCYPARGQSGMPAAVGSGSPALAVPGAAGTDPARGPGTTRTQTTDEHRLGQQRERGDQHGAGDHQPVVLLPEPEVDDAGRGRPRRPVRPGPRWRPPAPPPSGCRSSPAASPAGRSTRAITWRAAHAHGPGGLLHVGVDPAEADEGVGEDRRDGEDGQRDRRRPCRRTRSALTANRVSSASVGHRPADVGQRDDQPAAAPGGARARTPIGSAITIAARTATAEIARCSIVQVDDAVGPVQLNGSLR